MVKPGVSDAWSDIWMSTSAIRPVEEHMDRLLGDSWGS